ncbi:methionyl-tRNA formyltransferase [candidate division WOR-3 bacterium 4484_100]|uniref:Methionyl-tRNA formyltransferase n=1 Tax=candidate division WOR-3 bacterium 4484_100 TaxID=1936077 RepID=A0A1V4QHG7_UNCW3|nr:MAG: methionyl-tRNA formyltransferase [candidate division WOR-3 bacterium 4484_100]
MKIVFFGSGQFPLPVVQQLKENFDLIGIVTMKPKPGGRGLKTKLPEIIKWAQSQNITVFTPDNPNDPSFVEKISSLQPELLILSSYGFILKEPLLRIPKLGSINIHPSLLPKYRGAAPIQRALMSGEEKTGITVIFMDEKIDHGDIIYKKEVVIEPDENYGDLMARLSKLAGDIIVDIVNSIENKTYTRYPQNDNESSYAPKIRKEELFIDWNESTKTIHNKIRALSPSPGARTRFRNHLLMILKAMPGDKDVASGKLHIENRNLYAGTGDGSILLEELKPEGKKSMKAIDFINGYHIKKGEVLG